MNISTQVLKTGILKPIQVMSTEKHGELAFGEFRVNINVFKSGTRVLIIYISIIITFKLNGIQK